MIIRASGSLSLLTLTAAAALWAPFAQASQPVFTVLVNQGYEFVVPGSDGSFYGASNVEPEIDQLVPPASPGGAWTVTPLYVLTISPENYGPTSFIAGPTQPNGLPILYGTTADGGTANQGAVFSLTPPDSPGGSWTQTILHSFTGGSDLGSPAGMILGEGGILYGFSNVQVYPPSPQTVWSLTPPLIPGGPWTEAVIYESSNTQTALAFSRASNGRPMLYGVGSPGAYGYGMVNSLKPPASGVGSWTETVLYSFTDLTDGAGPWSLIIGPHGMLYGATSDGGDGNNGFQNGTVFSLTPPVEARGSWTHTAIYNPGEQGEPETLILSPGGTIYGAALGGGYGAGNIFSLTPPKSPGGSWRARGLHAFGKNSGGKRPLPLLLQDGVLYGATELDGTFFSLVP